MQSQYVLRECDRVNYDDVIKELNNIKNILANNNVWCNACIPGIDD